MIRVSKYNVSVKGLFHKERRGMGLTKLDERIINYNETEIRGDILYYVDYATRISFLEWIEIREDLDEIYVDISNSPLIHNDNYRIHATFDHSGKFKVGYSAFSGGKIRITRDQNKFKQKIKKEITRMNNMQGNIKKMLA